MPTVAEITAKLDAFAPPGLAADWDNVGLLAGDPAGPAGRVLTCLTVTPAVVAEAVADRVDLIVSHHPVLFRGAKKLTPSTPDGRVLLPLLRAGIAVYSPHTAFDNCVGGINDILCRRLGIVDVQPLRPKAGAKRFKLAVFTPEADLTKVSDAAFAAGAGIIGNYTECSFRTAGTGTFFGNDAANPAVGTKGRREEVAEWRLEFLVPAAKLAAVLTAVRAAHSYEESAYDVVPLHPPDAGGEGRVGVLSQPCPLGELVLRTKTQLNAATVQHVGDATQMVSRIAVACGAAGEFLNDAIKAKADAFLTGEMRFHDCLSAEAAGVAVLLPGHYASERPAVEELAEMIAGWFPGVTAWPSRAETDPVRVTESG